ncbi:hypothetical protein PDIP_32170 [Penicillium digitatum Pd1]|uniref:Uncharacterized protein n=1 Tax=Penicillium digitatum (strain Pd1 / CECT 20795) TaxID=1170230 RepID=K9G8C6_PEND1|nr:hypothetical protein PDIP_32170 [Penicillium digitatum Pd1]EKV17242.1 hypothetical protein PDIP_32170 [Penicillium digitatum Pd1]
MGARHARYDASRCQGAGWQDELKFKINRSEITCRDLPLFKHHGSHRDNSDTRETLRRRTPREIVEQADRTRETVARRKASAPLGGGCYFVAANVLPSGDVKMTVNSASGAELLRTHVEWLKAFGPAAHVRKPTWGVVARGIDTKTMPLTPESMGGLAKELIWQNSHSWGGSRDNVEILHLGWLIKPGHRPTSDACEVKAAAKEEARLALANSPLYHRVPLHFRQKEATKGNATTSQPQGANQGLNTSTHAPQQQVTQGTTTRRTTLTSNRINPKRIPVPAPSEIRRMNESVGTERAKRGALNRRKEAGPAMRTRSRTSGTTTCRLSQNLL